MAELEQVDRYRLDDFVLEGGSIHVDGEGTLITTEECLLSEGRNSHLTKEQIEEVLCNYLNFLSIVIVYLVSSTPKAKNLMDDNCIHHSLYFF